MQGQIKMAEQIKRFPKCRPVLFLQCDGGEYFPINPLCTLQLPMGKLRYFNVI